MLRDKSNAVKRLTAQINYQKTHRHVFRLCTETVVQLCFLHPTIFRIISFTFVKASRDTL